MLNFSKSLRTELAHVAQQSHFGACIRKNWNLDLEERSMLPGCLLTHGGQSTETTPMAITNGRKNAVHTCNRMPFGLWEKTKIKKREISAHATWVNLEDLKQSKLRRSQDRDRRIPFA